MRVLASLLVVSLLSIPAFAAGGGGGALREACKADVAALCQGIEPGGGRIKACLRANKDKLSEGCRSAIAAMIEARRAAKSQSQQPAPAPQTAPPVMGPVVP